MVVLLFEVGLESTIRDILRVGLSSFLVAVLGVAAPFALGWLVGAWLVPGHSWQTHAFLGATLCATSVGITARVLQDIYLRLLAIGLASVGLAFAANQLAFYVVMPMLSGGATDSAEFSIPAIIVGVLLVGSALYQLPAGNLVPIHAPLEVALCGDVHKVLQRTWRRSGV